MRYRVRAGRRRRAHEDFESIIATMTCAAPHDRRSPSTPRPSHRGRQALTLVAAVVGAGAVLALLTWSLAASDSPRTAATWRADFGLALSLTGPISVVAAMVWMLGVGTFTSGDITHARSGSRTQRAQATRAIRHGQPAAPEQVALTSAIARTMVRQRAATPIWFAAIAGPVGLLLQAPGVNRLVLIGLGLTVVGVALMIPTFAGIGRAQRWLDGAHHQ